MTRRSLGSPSTGSGATLRSHAKGNYTYRYYRILRPQGEVTQRRTVYIAKTMELRSEPFSLSTAKESFAGAMFPRWGVNPGADGILKALEALPHAQCRLPS